MLMALWVTRKTNRTGRYYLKKETGRYQQRVGVPTVINDEPANDDHYLGLYPTEVPYPKLLKEAGYTSAIFGKWKEDVKQA